MNIKSCFTFIVMFFPAAIFAHARTSPLKSHPLYRACKPDLPGVRIDRKIVIHQYHQIIQFYCFGPLGGITKDSRHLSKYLRGVRIINSISHKLQSSWETQTGLNTVFDLRMNRLWIVKSNTRIITVYVKISNVAADLVALKVVNGKLIVLGEWNAPAAHVWLRHDRLNIAIAPRTEAIPEIYQWQNTKFILTPNSQHPEYFIHQAEQYHQNLRKIRIPSDLAATCIADINFAKIARVPSIGLNACRFAKRIIHSSHRFSGNEPANLPLWQKDKIKALQQINQAISETRSPPPIPRFQYYKVIYTRTCLINSYRPIMACIFIQMRAQPNWRW